MRLHHQKRHPPLFAKMIWIWKLTMIITLMLELLRDWLNSHHFHLQGKIVSIHISRLDKKSPGSVAKLSKLKSTVETKKRRQNTAFGRHSDVLLHNRTKRLQNRQAVVAKSVEEEVAKRKEEERRRKSRESTEKESTLTREKKANKKEKEQIRKKGNAWILRIVVQMKKRQRRKKKSG